MHLGLSSHTARMEDFTSDDNATSPIGRITLDFPIMGQNMTYGQEVFRKCVVIVGVFLNCLIIFVVSFSRQLRYPRHTFWALIAFFECVFLVKCVLELAVIVHHDLLACKILVVLAPADYSILLLCLSLAALDRYLAIVRYEWYKSSVSSRRVIFLISVLCILTCVIITIPFWTGYQSIHTCTNNLTHIHWILVWDLFLGTVGVILHLMIFMESRAIIQQYLPNCHQEPITVRFVNSSVRQLNSISGGYLIPYFFSLQLLWTLHSFCSPRQRECEVSDILKGSQQGCWMEISVSLLGRICTQLFFCQ